MCLSHEATGYFGMGQGRVPWHFQNGFTYVGGIIESFLHPTYPCDPPPNSAPQDHGDAEQLLSPANVDQDALLRYARDAAHFSTQRRLPGLQFSQNQAGRPDVAVFDFTCMFRAENASLVRERRGRRLLVGLVGDCLVEVRQPPSLAPVSGPRGPVSPGFMCLKRSGHAQSQS